MTRAVYATEIEGPAWVAPRAAYVHIPFCAHHCGYCDFAVVAGRDHLADAYLDALGVELRLLGRPRTVETLFLGGGTPSHLTIRQWRRLLDDLDLWLPREPSGEFTIEANPESLDADKLALLAERGVNRISLGGQSFDRGLLQVLERRHDPDAIARAVESAKPLIHSLSLDLIFAAPGQTLEQWDGDLRRAVSLPINHLSTYGLTFEKGTRLWKQRAAGQVLPLSDADEATMYRHAMAVLPAAGFAQYEISNFARPGKQSRHNQVYWANHAYYGFGLGATRYVAGVRSTNTRDLDRYLRCLGEAFSPAQSTECLPPLERAKETAMTQIRRVAGIEREAFRAQTAFDFDSLFAVTLRKHVERQWLEDTGPVVRLTLEGRLFADAICRDLLA